MSILSQIMSRQIGWTEAKTRIEAWFAGIAAKLGDAAKPAVAAAEADLKQAASNAISLADQAAAPHLAEFADMAGAWFANAVSAYLGPVAAGALTPAIHDALDTLAAGAKAELDALAAQLKAELAGAPRQG
jgi:ubiquinone biosynthesis protein UbiJ